MRLSSTNNRKAMPRKRSLEREPRTSSIDHNPAILARTTRFSFMTIASISTPGKMRKITKIRFRRDSICSRRVRVWKSGTDNRQISSIRYKFHGMVRTIRNRTSTTIGICRALWKTPDLIEGMGVSKSILILGTRVNERTTPIMMLTVYTNFRCKTLE